jgi:hypothetical protein
VATPLPEFLTEGLDEIDKVFFIIRGLERVPGLTTVDFFALVIFLFGEPDFVIAM